MKLARSLSLLIVVAGAGAACTDILALNAEFTSAAETLCKCDAFTDSEKPFWPDVSGSDGCVEYIEGRLENGDSKAWLKLYQTSDCDSCENASLCVAAAPVCIPTGEPCNGESIASDASCCGYDPEQVTNSYCGPSNVCSTNAPGCKVPFDECAEDIDCCGGDAGLAFCIPETEEPDSKTLCLNVCELDDPVQCPGCCARIKPKTGEPEYGVCFNFEGPLRECEELCLSGSDCGLDALCSPIEFEVLFLYACVDITQPL